MKYAILGLALFNFNVSAAEISYLISWDQPATYENGDILAPGDIKGYSIDYIRTSNGITEQGVITLDGLNTSHIDTIQADVGIEYTSEYRVLTRHNNGSLSEWSDPAISSKIGIEHKPSAPINIRVTFECAPVCVILDATTL